MSINCWRSVYGVVAQPQIKRRESMRAHKARFFGVDSRFINSLSLLVFLMIIRHPRPEGKRRDVPDVAGQKGARYEKSS
jgi:hypothetical protein